MIATQTYSGYEEETILTPFETQFSLEVYLHDWEFLGVKNGFAEHVFYFAPKTPQDYSVIQEALHRALTDVELKKSPYSRKRAEQACRKPGQKDIYFCSQLFTPKVNVEIAEIDQRTVPEASLELHFRDDPDGKVYLQASYVDVYDNSCGTEEVVNSLVPVDYDF